MLRVAQERHFGARAAYASMPVMAQADNPTKWGLSANFIKLAFPYLPIFCIVPLSDTITSPYPKIHDGYD